MARKFIFQGDNQLHLWLAGQHPILLMMAYVRRVVTKPGSRSLVIIEALFDYPANLLYPFNDGTTLELRYCESGRVDSYDNGRLVIGFQNCKLLSARHTNLNAGDERPLSVKLFVECDVLYDWLIDN